MAASVCSGASVIFGTGVSDAVPGSVGGLHLVVDDVVAARAELVGRGITVSEVFHDEGGVFHRAQILGLLKKDAPGVGQIQSPLSPSHQEQFRAVFFFQMAHLVAERRLSQT